MILVTVTFVISGLPTSFPGRAYTPGIAPAQPLSTGATTQDPCSPGPTIGLLAPLGGEILDVGTVFKITWSTDDPGGALSSVGVYLSTNGGSTFTNLATVPTYLTEYSWTVPAMANKANAQILLVGNSNSCNNAPQARSGNFIVWNRGPALPRIAEAPLFFAGQGFTSTIYLTNTSSNAVTVELDPHKPNGNATQNFPSQMSLNAGASATVDAASLYTIGASAENPAVSDIINGGLRLRHNGSKDSDVRAVIVAERSGTQKFTTPFTYPASSQSASGTMQCGPIYYVDNNTDAFVSLQNVTNAPQTVQLTCNYGTGAGGTPNGQVKNQPISLGPQQTYIVNLASIWSQFGGAEWGSMEIFTTDPRTVVCHSVMMSAQNVIAWDCPFVDPAMSVSTTKVAETVMLDYNANENAYIMVCNTSATDSRTVAASFKTSNGVTIPPAQVTLAPGAQQMITLNARQLLSPGGSTIADARLTYAGNASDIVAAGCSMSPDDSHAVPVKFKEASASDGRRLTSPFFRFDQSVSGKLQISNLGSSSVKVGARMVFANSTAKPLKTGLTTVPAGGTAMLDLSTANDGVPDGINSSGRVDLIHSGPAGTVTAAVTALGNLDNSGHVIPLDAGPPIDPVTLFPTAVVVIPGGCSVVDAITDGTITNPTLSSSNPCFGTAIQMFGTGPNTFQTTICVPINCTGDVPISFTPPGGTGAGDESDLEVVQSNFADFSTSLGKRLNPNGTTSFTLTAQNAFPNALLEVDFVDPKGKSVSTQVQGNGVSNSVTGTGPVNHTFLGNVKKIQVIQLNPDGTPNTSVSTVLKAKKTGAYFALDPPTSITSVTPNAVPVTGGTVTIKGTGFQTWQLGTAPNTVTVNPVVLIGGRTLKNHDQIPFTVISVTTDQTTILGNVGPTPNTVSTCAVEGQTPCKRITVINPGGSDGVDNFTSENLLTINPPPPPVIEGTAALTVTGAAGPATSNSIGMQDIRVVGGLTVASPVTARIIGRNLGRVQSVTFGSSPALVGPSNINRNGTRIEVSVPAFCVTGTQASVPVIVDDGINAPVSFANGWIYTATGPIQIFIRGVPTNSVVFVVGPCERLNIGATTWNVPGVGDGFLDNSQNCSFINVSCARIVNVSFSEKTGLTTVFPNANFGLLTWGTSCASCTGATGTVSGTFLVDSTNTTSGRRAPTICQSASCKP